MLNGVPLLVAPPVQTASTLVLSNSSTGVGTLTCTGLLYTSTYSALFPPAVGDESTLLARIQGRQYLSESLSASAAEAVSVRGILRTAAARVDRNRVMVAYQLHDSHGNVRVMTQGLAVDFALSAVGLSTITASCSVSLQGHTHYLGHCVLRCATHAL